MEIELSESEYDGVYVGMPVPFPGFFGVIIGQAEVNGVVRYAAMDDSDEGIPDDERRIVLLPGESVEAYRLE